MIVNAKGIFTYLIQNKGKPIALFVSNYNIYCKRLSLKYYYGSIWSENGLLNFNFESLINKKGFGKYQKRKLPVLQKYL